jgi:tRNA1(Val) A37 N6-methylase TrmN6
VTTGTSRPARRPRGWRAPGPAPAGAGGDPTLLPAAGEDLCHLAGDWRIFQHVGGHRWSLDDLVTGWMAAEEMAERPPARVADLGCGIGTVLMLLAWRFPEARIAGLEAEAEKVALARRSLRWNGCADRCLVHVGDLRETGALHGPFDLVSGTPPYLPRGTATEPARPDRGPWHFEHRGGIEDYCRAAARLLAPDAPFVVCAGTTQESRMQEAAAAAGLRITRRRDVVPRAGKAALFALYVLRAAPAETAGVEPPLVVRDARGAWTPAFRAVRRAMGMPDRPPGRVSRTGFPG